MSQLNPPSAPFFGREPPSPGLSTPRDSYASTPTQKEPLLEQDASARNSDVPREYDPRASGAARKPWYKRPLWLAVGAAAFVAVVLVIVLPIVFTVGKKHGLAGGSGTDGSGSNPQSPTGATTGGNGSEVIMEDGTKFTYINNFGGFWVQDPNDPFNNNAQPNSWTPPLNQTWDWGKNRVFGVNLGGWFVIEPFIMPSFFQKYNGTVDEWTLSIAMANDTASGGLQQLEDHYNTFITEQDFAEIAGAGLNWVRLPIPFWAIDKWDDEPFLAKVCWKYIVRAFSWARKYGIRVNLDLHTIPGSQNGYNHSGKLGSINFLNGIMGVANAQRALDYVRIIAEFIAQPEYQNVIPIFGMVNEPLLGIIGQDELTRFYLQGYDEIRAITGIGEGHGPYISIHDGFQGLGIWKDFLPGADRFILDTHPYFAFGGMQNVPIAVPDDDGDNYGGTWPKQACLSWGIGQNQSQLDFGVTIAGEFSAGFNPCGLFLQGVDETIPDYCPFWMDSSQWNETTKAGLMQFTLASMDALQHWFFWTWKIGNSSTTNTVQCPLWSYKLGLENGWIPTDPRQAVGKCGALNVTAPVQFNGSYQAWQTGGAGAGTIDPTVSSSYAQWPPAQISGASVPVAQLPMYTATGAVETLPNPTVSGPASKTLSPYGWDDPSDTAPGVTEIAGCSYPDAWGPASLPPVCTGPASKRGVAREVPAPLVTPPPAWR
ncbi:glycoside hydrolase family 5 protein [Heliocybe sulcata]|uniref:glucan 1,3-beta-glucosidase n=1 Tax=Heliocybe sulcata TaxID=5364 RepID=A0A5C3N0W4_9AGAM|nr:glycoside hydrolase family 5 protein [Heliocybe sulcata]